MTLLTYGVLVHLVLWTLLILLQFHPPSSLPSLPPSPRRITPPPWTRDDPVRHKPRRPPKLQVLTYALDACPRNQSTSLTHEATDPPLTAQRPIVEESHKPQGKNDEPTPPTI